MKKKIFTFKQMKPQKFGGKKKTNLELREKKNRIYEENCALLIGKKIISSSNNH